MQIDKNNWQIKIDVDNKEEVIEYLKGEYICDIGYYYGMYRGYSIKFSNNLYYNRCPTITTEQFRKYILGKEERKITGYKAPFDTPNLEITEGNIFTYLFIKKRGNFYNGNIKI